MLETQGFPGEPFLVTLVLFYSKLFLVVAGLAVLVNVEAFVFYASGDAQAVQFPDAVEEDESAGRSPEVYNQYAKALCAKKAPAVTVERAAGGGEQACEKCAEYAAYAVD